VEVSSVVLSGGDPDFKKRRKRFAAGIEGSRRMKMKRAFGGIFIRAGSLGPVGALNPPSS